MQYEQVKELIAIFEKTDLNDMEVQLDNAVIRLNRGSVSPWQQGTSAPVQASTPVAVQNVAPAVTNTTGNASDTVGADVTTGKSEVTTEVTSTSGKVIKAPIVGTFYQSPAPDKDAFVKVGDTITEGDVVCIIEAMKFMNEVTSEVSGKIVEVLVGDGEFVEFGQALFRVE